MLGTDDFISISVLFNRSVSVLRNKTQEFMPNKADLDYEKFLEIQILRDRNIFAASKYLVRDIAMKFYSQGDRRIYFLQKAGTMIMAPIELLEGHREKLEGDTEYWAARNKLISVGDINKRELAFGMETLRSEFWRVCFVNEVVFSNSRSPRLFMMLKNPFLHEGLLNWTTGVLELSQLSVALDAFHKLRDICTTLAANDIDIGYRQLRDMKYFDVMGVANSSAEVFRVLSNYADCPIVIPRSWGDELKCIATKVKAEASRPRVGLPKDEILDLLDQEPWLSKSEVRERLFPSASVRQFDRYWRQAAEENPDLTKPGRKSKKS